MSNPFVFAVMNAFKGKLPKSKERPKQADKPQNQTPPPPSAPREER